MRQMTTGLELYLQEQGLTRTLQKKGVDIPIPTTQITRIPKFNRIFLKYQRKYNKMKKGICPRNCHPKTSVKLREKNCLGSPHREIIKNAGRVMVLCKDGKTNLKWLVSDSQGQNAPLMTM